PQEEPASAAGYAVQPAPAIAPIASVRTEAPAKVTSPESELSREAVKDLAPIDLHISEDSTYPVVCETCGVEVGRSIVANSTIICPNCRSKHRHSGSLPHIEE